MLTNSIAFDGLFLLNSVFIFKIGMLIFAILYFLFTLVVIRQVGLMTDTVRTQAAPILKLVSFLFTLLALGVVIFFFLML